MNFLAHIYLSFDQEELLIGNFLGDFVKGSQGKHYSKGIQKGIQLHREIDHYTDRHPTVMQSKVLLRPQFRHYAPVIVDVLYDHFLAKFWDDYSEVPLLTYTTQFYTLMECHKDILPEKAQNMLYYMEKGNWLYNYQSIEGIHQALTGMSRRTRFDSKMELASGTLETHYDSFLQDFRLFFPDLIAFAQTHIK